jgi:hypothetical protein
MTFHAVEFGKKPLAFITNLMDKSGGKRLWWTPADRIPAWTVCRKNAICQAIVRLRP